MAEFSITPMGAPVVLMDRLSMEQKELLAKLRRVYRTRRTSPRYLDRNVLATGISFVRQYAEEKGLQTWKFRDSAEALVEMGVVVGHALAAPDEQSFEICFVTEWKW
jgi:hypothetical protein